MSYQFKSDNIYRMPTHFGPSLGPRQGPNGRNFDNVQTPKTTTLTLSFSSNSEQLENLLPSCFQLGREPIVTVQFSKMTELEWLAGRGYSMLGISFPACFKGKFHRVNGSFLCVLWENLCDPIITGREELGFSKIYSELSEPVISESGTSVTASWMGFDFLTMKFDNLKENLQITSSPTDPESEGLLHYKYIPKTGKQGIADAAYPVFSPFNGSHIKVLTKKTGTGSIHWNKARWEDLPTFYNVVNILADLEINKYLSASLSQSIGSKSLSDQMILE